MISVTSVSVSHDTVAGEVLALDALNLNVGAGEYVALLGTSGSGKTTLLNVIGGVVLPTAGDVEVAGHAINSMSENDRASVRLNSVGIIFQDNNLVAEFTALENVMLPLSARGWAKAAATNESRRLLAQFGLEGMERRKPVELSGGQKQRVGIARGLAGGRTILLADEPTGALDSVNSQAVFQLLRDIADTGVAVVVATHDPIVENFASRVVSLRDGRIVADSTRVRA